MAPRRTTLIAVVTYEIESFQNYFNLRRRPTEIILFQRVETYVKLFQKFLQLMNIFSLVQCGWDNFSGRNNFISVSDIIIC